MARNLENSTSENSNVQEMGLRRSVRLNATISGAAPPPRVSTMGTTTVATSVATRGEVHGAYTTARAVPSKAHSIKATAQVPAPAKQPALMTQPAPDEQPTPVIQPAPAKQLALVTQPTPVKQPTLTAQPALVAFQAAQVGPRLSQPSGPTI
ncbi:hypothetical protein ACFX1X_022355 [Malus domestica]